MAISLKNLLLIAENTGLNPDGSNFDKRSLGYGEGAGKFQFDTQPPYIIKDLPGVEESTNGKLDLVGEVTDNFVRGGAVTLATRAVKDVERLTKVLVSPNGLSWVASQYALALTNPQNVISPTNRLFNSLPAPGSMTLATVGTGAAGIRFRKDGIVDVNFESGFNYDSTRGGRKYESSILEIVRGSGTDINSSEGVGDHNLLGTYYNVIGAQVGNQSGRFLRQDLIKEYKGGAHSVFGIGDTEIKRYKADPYNGYLQFFNKNLFSLRQGDLTTKPDTGDANYNDYKTVQGKGPVIEKIKTRINLYDLGDPGINLQTDEGNYDVYNVKTIDKISAANIFQRKNLESFDSSFKDYIKFRIAVVDTENPLNDNIILFRALLDNLSDNYSGDWTGYKYNGRAEEFFTYSGFNRGISFGFKIHTQTRHEQKPLWRKLNYLVAQTAPEYKNRRMRGVFSRLTIGDWMNEIPGFFKSVNLSWNTAYPWEIRHDAEGADRDLNEYPHILDVSCEFQPVHNFAPSNSVTTPFIIPDIGVNDSQKYIKVSDDEFANEGEGFNKGTFVSSEAREAYSNI